MSIEYDKTVTISVNVGDFASAKRFYGEVLGLPLLYEVAEIGWAEFESSASGTTIGINLVETDEDKGGVVPTFGVKDIDAARKQLEAAGVQFDGETVEIEGMVKLANFVDPFENRLCLAQSLT